MNLTPDTFSIDKQFVQYMKFGVVLSAGLALLGMALPFMPDDESVAGCTVADPAGTYVVSAFLVLCSGAATWYLIGIVRNIPLTSISVDEEGIWYSHLRKEEGLVEWKDIAAVKERQYLQRVDMIGRDGNVLVRLEYQLSRFGQLRSFVLERISKYVKVPQLPICVAKSPLYHVGNVAGLVGFGVLGWIVGRDNPWVGYLGVGLMEIAIAREYFTTAWRTTIDKDGIRIEYPTVQREHTWENVESVSLSDVFDRNGVMHPQVLVSVKGASEPFLLENLKMDATILYRALMVAWKGETPMEAPEPEIRSDLIQQTKPTEAGGTGGDLLSTVRTNEGS